MLLNGYAARSQALRQALLKGMVVVSAVACLATGAVALAKPADMPAAVPSVPLSSLPAEAQQTERLIRAGGPFASVKDGIVFGNRERVLPHRPRGHYREYTVRTPGAKNRGARRIVCGGTPPTAPEVCFYTDDHYASFRRIAP